MDDGVYVSKQIKYDDWQALKTKFDEVNKEVSNKSGNAKSKKRFL